MEIAITGKNMEVTPALREYAEKKLQKIQKYFEKRLVGTEVTLRVERERHIADVTIHVGGLILRGEGKTDDMYISINEAVDRIERQIRKFKTRINRKMRQQDNRVLDIPSESPEPEEQVDEARVVKKKRFAIKPMSVQEAIMQMDLLGHDFYVFTNDETLQVNVVYRRRDGDYGIIEPEV